MSRRRLWTLIRREVLATFRDPFTVAILILVPIMALLAFSFVISSEVHGLRLAVLDGDRSSESRRLVADIGATGWFVPQPVATRDQIERGLRGGALGAALVIPPDFSRRIGEGRRPEVQLLYDAAETVLAGNAEGALRSLVAASGGQLTRAAGAGGVAVVTGVLFNPRLDGTPFMVAGTFGFVLSFLTTLITAVTIVNERLSGTFDQLQVTPATSLEILLGKLLPLGAIFALDVVLMMLVAGFAFGVWPAGSALFFVVVSTFYILVSLSLGLIFSATSSTAAEAVQKTVLFSIPLVQVSGFAFPIRNMPTAVQWFAQLFPATHYIRVSRGIYLRGEGPLALLPELCLLALFGFVLLALALRTLEARGVIARFRRTVSNILAVAYRESLVLRHDKGFLATVVSQPVTMLLLFGFALSYTPANVPWAVFDRSASAVSRRLVEDVRTTGYFLAPRAVHSYAEGRALLRRGAVLALLVVPRDFRRDLERGRPQVQLLVDGSDPITAARVLAYVGQVAAHDVGRAIPARTGDDLGLRTTGPIDVRQRFWFNPTLRDRNFFMAILAGMLLTNMCLSMSALNIVGERESGTFEQTLSLPVSTLEIVLGKLLPLVAVSYLLLAVAVLGSGLVFGLWPQGSWLALVLITLPFVLASLAIGVFVSALARSSAQAVFITVFFIMPSFVLSGVMFPYELMPPAVRVLGGMLPLRWYQIALRRVISRGATFEDVAGPCLALLAIFVVMLAGIRWRLKPRLG